VFCVCVCASVYGQLLVPLAFLFNGTLPFIFNVVFTQRVFCDSDEQYANVDQTRDSGLGLKQNADCKLRQ